MSNEFDWQHGEDFDSGNKFLETPCMAHCVVSDVQVPAKRSNGELIDSGLFSYTLKVIEASVPGQKDKEFNGVFFRPSLDSKDNGAMARKKVDRFLVATCLAKPDDKGQKGKVNPTKAIGRQLLVKFGTRPGKKNSEGKIPEYLDVSFANFFHVDDPEASEYPRSQESLAILPGELRRIGGEPAVSQEPKVNPIDKAESLDL